MAARGLSEGVRPADWLALVDIFTGDLRRLFLCCKIMLGLKPLCSCIRGGGIGEASLCLLGVSLFRAASRSFGENTPLGLIEEGSLDSL